jgi:hypothetical protein
MSAECLRRRQQDGELCSVFFLKKNHTYSFNPTPMMCKIERMSSKKIKFLQIKTNKSVKKFIFFVIAKL